MAHGFTPDQVNDMPYRYVTGFLAWIPFVHAYKRGDLY